MSCLLLGNLLNNITAWAYEWCKGDTGLFIKSISDRDPILINHLNKKAQFYVRKAVLMIAANNI